MGGIHEPAVVADGPDAAGLRLRYAARTARLGDGSRPSARRRHWRSGSGRDEWPTCRRSRAGSRALRRPVPVEILICRVWARRWRRCPRPGQRSTPGPGRNARSRPDSRRQDRSSRRHAPFEMQKGHRPLESSLQVVARASDVHRVGETLGLFDQHLEGPGASLRASSRAGSGGHQPTTRREPSRLGDDENVERLPRARDDFDDVAVAPWRVQPVDANGAHRPAPIQPGQRPTAIARAASFADGAHASSRSKNTRSAPERAAFSHMCSLLAGVASSDRRDLGSRTSASSSASGHGQITPAARARRAGQEPFRGAPRRWRPCRPRGRARDDRFAPESPRALPRGPAPSPSRSPVRHPYEGPPGSQVLVF